MGVVLSTHSTLAPVSLASSIIGFVSFAFTVATAVRVFWENLNTIWEAPQEVHEILTNLRIELYEEKRSLRQLRKHNKDFGHRHSDKGRAPLKLDDLTIRSMQESVRHLIRKFRMLEKPFLAENNATGRRRRSSFSSPSYGPYASGYGDEKNARGRDRDRDKDDDDENIDPNMYCNITLGKRFVWLRHRGTAIGLMESISRVQTRRIARQVGEISVALWEYGGEVDDVREGMEDIQARLNRVVGIRRVD